MCICVFRCMHMCPVGLRGSHTLWLDGVTGSCEQPSTHAGTIICFSCKNSKHLWLLSLLSIPQIKFLDSTFQQRSCGFPLRAWFIPGHHVFCMYSLLLTVRGFYLFLRFSRISLLVFHFYSTQWPQFLFFLFFFLFAHPLMGTAIANLGCWLDTSGKRESQLKNCLHHIDLVWHACVALSWLQIDEEVPSPLWVVGLGCVER